MRKAEARASRSSRVGGSALNLGISGLDAMIFESVVVGLCILGV